MKELLDSLSSNRLLHLASVLENAYYNHSTSVLPDEVYDAIIKVLADRGIESERTEEGYDKELHPSIMGSTYRCYVMPDISKWLKRLRKARPNSNSIHFMPKVDGIGVSFAYFAGKLVSVTTRDKGMRGKSRRKFMIDNGLLPEHISHNGYIEGKLEIYLDRNSYDLVCKNRIKAEPSPSRNIVSGFVNSQVIDWYPEVKLKASVYFADLGMASLEENLKALKEAAPSIEVIKIIKTFDIDKESEIDSYINDLSEDRYFENDTPIDGYILASDDMSKRNDGERKPIGMMAYKLPTAKAFGVIKDIEYGVNGMGRVIAKAILAETMRLGYISCDAIMIGETSHQTKYNQFKNKVIRCQLSGDISVQVINTYETAPVPAHYPSSCPACGSPLVGDGIESPHTCSKGKFCKGALVRQIIRIIGPEKLDLRGIGKRTLEQWPVELDHIDKLFLVDEETLKTRFGVKSGAIIYKTLQSNKVLIKGEYFSNEKDNRH